MEDQTYSEIVAAAEYSEERMHYNNDLHGRPENPADTQKETDCLTGWGDVLRSPFPPADADGLAL
jgi:hypothetical protein